MCLLPLGLFAQPASAATTAPAPVTFTLANPGDTNGVFHWLGTNRNKTAFSNPVTNGQVTELGSGALSATYGGANLTDRADSYPFNSTNNPDSWVGWDLGEATSLQVSKYTLRGRSDAPVHMPRSWKLEGSNDGVSWSTIDTRTNVAISVNTWSTFVAPTSAASYSQIRIRQTALNSSNTDYLILNEVELYGTIAERVSTAATCDAAAPVAGTAADPTAVQFDCSVPGDSNGLFHWLGTDRGQTQFNNPVFTGAVEASTSGAYSQAYDVFNLTDRIDGVPFNSAGGAGAWVQWNLGDTTSMEVTRYTLRGRPDAPSHMPVSWDLEGSNDGAAWTLIDRRVDDKTIKQSSWAVFDVASSPGTFKQLRLTQTAANTSGVDYLVLGEAEFYGVAIEVASSTKTCKTPLEVTATASPNATSTKDLVCSNAGDSNGLFHWLGSDKGASEFSNPAVTGAVGAAASSTYPGYDITNLTDRADGVPFNSLAVPNSSVAWDLGEGAGMHVTRYTIKGRPDATSHMPVSWDLEGSNDGTSWTLVDRRVDDTTIKQGKWSTFDVEADLGSFRNLRITQTSVNSSGVDYLVLGEVEFYGKYVTLPLAPPPPPPVVVQNDTTLTVVDRTISYGATAVGMQANVAGTTTVNEGNVTFTLRNAKGEVVGTPITVAVIAGEASGGYALPSGLSFGEYAIEARFEATTNFKAASANGTVSMRKAPLTISVENASRTVGNDNPLFVITYDGLVNGDTPASLSAPVLETTADRNSPIGTYPVMITGGTSDKYDITYVDGRLTVVGAPLTVTVNNSARAYGEANPQFTASYTGFVNGEGPEALTGSLKFDTVANTQSLPGSYAVAASGLSSDRYEITYVDGTLSVGPGDLIVTVTPSTKVYGAENPAFSVTYQGFAAGDGPESLGGQLSFTTDAGVLSPVGTYEVKAGGLTSSKYSVRFVHSTLEITPAVVTVTADSFTKVYGSDNPQLSVTYDGFVNGEGPAHLNGALVLETTAVKFSPVGTYPINVSGLSSANYRLVFVDGTLEVTPAPLVIRVEDAEKTYGEENPELDVTYEGLVKEDDVTALDEKVNVETDADQSSDSGEYDTNVRDVTDPNYEITFVPGKLIVKKAPLTVTADDATKVYGSENPQFSATYTGLVDGDTPESLGELTLATVATATSAAGRYAITPSGLVSDNYEISYVDGTLTVTKAELTVTANDATKVYGSENPVFSAAYTGLVNGDSPESLGTLVITTEATASSPVGEYAIVPSGLAAENYDVTYVNGTLAITPAALTVKVHDATKVYGAALPAFSADYTGLVPSDNGSWIGHPTFETAATAASPVGTYPVTITGLASPNYVITIVPGTLTITRAGLVIKADDKTKVQGTANPVLTASYSGLVAGDSAADLTGTLVLGTTATQTSAAGSYPITASGVTSPNYDITFVDGTLTVTPLVVITPPTTTPEAGQVDAGDECKVGDDKLWPSGWFDDDKKSSSKKSDDKDNKGWHLGWSVKDKDDDKKSSGTKSDDDCEVSSEDDDSSKKKGGRTIPIKWEINDKSFNTKASHTWRIERRQVSCKTDAAIGSWGTFGSTNNKDVKTDGKANRFKYVADFRDAGKNTCWEVRVFVDNGSKPVHTEQVKA